MNICMVGYGSIAEVHMTCFGRMQDIRPYYLVGRRPEPSAEFAQKWAFEKLTVDLDEALADDHIDAVVITSPNEQHAGQAIKTLEAKKHLLLEIPIAMNADDARRITELSRKVDRRLMICHTMRFNPALAYVHQQVEQGKLHLHQIAIFFGQQRRTNTSWTGRQRSWTDNLLWHHGAHHVDLALWIAHSGDPKDVTCHFGPIHPTQNIMDLNLSMVLDGGVLANIAQSYNIIAAKSRTRALFIGDEATFEFTDHRLIDGDGNEIVPAQEVVHVQAQNEDFVAAVRDGRDPVITGEDVLPCMQALQRAQDAAAGR